MLLSTTISYALLKVCNLINSCSNYTNAINYSNLNIRSLSTLADIVADSVDSDMIPSIIQYYLEYINDTATFDYVFYMMYDYFNTVLASKQALDALIDTASAALKYKSYILNGTYALNTANLFFSFIDNYGNTLTNQEVTRILDILSPYSSNIDPINIANLLKLLGILWINKSPINTKLEYSSNITLLRYRLSSESIVNSTLLLNSSTILIPLNLNLTENMIYDIQFFQFYSLNYYFGLNLYIAGSDMSYTINLTNPIPIDMQFISPITVIFNGSFDINQHYGCLYRNIDSWEQGKCQINNINSTFINISLTGTSDFQIAADSGSCNKGNSAIIAMCVFVTI